MCFCRTSKHRTDNNSSTVVYKAMRLLTTDKVMPVFYYTNKYYSIGSVLRASEDVPVSEMDKLYAFEGEVVHAYTSKAKATNVAIFLKEFCSMPVAVVECVIPAGAPYWVSEYHHEIAAKEMKITAIHL